MGLTNAQAALLDRGDNLSNTTYNGNLYIPAKTQPTTVVSIPKPLLTGDWANQGAATVPQANTSGLSLREQMQRGLIPWDDNQLNAGNSDPYAAVRNDISNAWDSYLNSLGSTSGYLNDQNTAQQQIANSQYNQGANTIQAQKASSLKDIANTTRNAFQAGNNYLGQLGAGDSSAANQYTFAINQQASRQTGDLNNYVNTQLNQLGYQRDQQLSQIAQWFSSAQQQLKQQIAQGQLSKGQDLANLSKGILDQAIAATNQVKANTQNQYNSLVTWAANNSTNINQLKSNIAQIPQAMGQINTYGNTSNTPRYGGATPSNGSRTDIFGNPIA